jgi:hypothetical protein
MLGDRYWIDIQRLGYRHSGSQMIGALYPSWGANEMEKACPVAALQAPNTRYDMFFGRPPFLVTSSSKKHES